MQTDAGIGKRVDDGRHADRPPSAAAEVGGRHQKQAAAAKKFAEAMDRDAVQQRHARTVQRIVDAYRSVLGVVQGLHQASTASRGDQAEVQGEKKSVESVLSGLVVDAVSKENIVMAAMTLARSMLRSPVQSHKEVAGSILTFAAEKYSSKARCAVIDGSNQTAVCQTVACSLAFSESRLWVGPVRKCLADSGTEIGKSEWLQNRLIGFLTSGGIREAEKEFYLMILDHAILNEGFMEKVEKINREKQISDSVK